MIQMHMVTGEQCPTHAQAAVSITNLVNETLAKLQDEEGDSDPEDICRIETHLSHEKVSVWNGTDFDKVTKYQYIAFIWVNEKVPFAYINE